VHLQVVFSVAELSLGNSEFGQTLALVAFGANLGDVDENIRRALEMLGNVVGVTVMKTSSVWHTLPVGGPSGQPVFSNGAVLVKTSLSPHALLEELHEIEIELQRVRNEFWGPRTIDLDLISYGNLIITTSELILPHPRVYWRHFVLDPVCEIAPDIVLSTTGLSFRETRRLLYNNFKLYDLASFFLHMAAALE